MSHAMVLAADRPLPEFERLVWKRMKSGRLTVEGQFGPIVRPGGFNLPACRCETAKTVYHDLDLQEDQQSLDALRTYLLDTLSPGETVELWEFGSGNTATTKAISPLWRTTPAPIKPPPAGPSHRRSCLLQT